MREKVWQLRQCGLFGQLTMEQCERIAAASSSRDIPAHNTVSLPSLVANRLFLLVSGLVRVSHLTADGKESILAFMESGEIFGESALFEHAGTGECVIAVERCEVMAIPAHAMRSVMADNPAVAMGVTELVHQRRCRLETRLKNLLFRSNRERLVHLLLDLAEQFGTLVDGVIKLRVRLSHQELANMIGVTRESVTLNLGQLRDQQCVAYGRRTIVLTDPHQLAQRVDRHDWGTKRLSAYCDCAVSESVAPHFVR